MCTDELQYQSLERVSGKQIFYAAVWLSSKGEENAAIQWSIVAD